MSLLPQENEKDSQASNETGNTSHSPVAETTLPVQMIEGFEIVPLEALINHRPLGPNLAAKQCEFRALRLDQYLPDIKILDL